MGRRGYHKLEMNFRVGDKVRGIGADIGGCEGTIEAVNARGEFSIRITKLGKEPWQDGNDPDWQVGKLIGSFNGSSARFTKWVGSLELITHKKVTKAQKLKLEQKRKEIIKEIKKRPDFLSQFTNVEDEVNKWSKDQVINWK